MVRGESYGRGGCKRLRTQRTWEFSENANVKVNSFKSLRNKYSQLIFNLSYTRTQEIKSEGVISNCQFCGHNLGGRRYNFTNGLDSTN